MGAPPPRLPPRCCCLASPYSISHPRPSLPTIPPSRCHRHWIPATVNHAAAALVNNYIRPAVAYLLPTPVVLDDLEGGDDKGRRRTSTVNVEVPCPLFHPSSLSH